MKSIKLLLLFCAVLAFVFSCGKDDCKSENNDDNDYLMFGRFNGECMGEKCIEIFKMEDGKIYEDIKDSYPERKKAYEGNFEEIHPDEINIIKELRGKLPAQLLNEKDTVIGAPDVADQGGLYIEIKENGKRRFWLIDQAKQSVPSYLHAFMDDVNAAIAKLQ